MFLVLMLSFACVLLLLFEWTYWWSSIERIVDVVFVGEVLDVGFNI